MEYLLALAVCAGIIFVYGIIVAALGFHNSGRIHPWQ